MLAALMPGDGHLGHLPPPGLPTSPPRRPSPAPDPRPGPQPPQARAKLRAPQSPWPSRATRRGAASAGASRDPRRGAGATEDHTAGPAPKLLTWRRGRETPTNQKRPESILKPSLRPQRERGTRSLQGWEAEGTGREQKAGAGPPTSCHLGRHAGPTLGSLLCCHHCAAF